MAKHKIIEGYRLGGILIAGNTIEEIEHEIEMLTCDQVKMLCEICGCGVDKIIDVVARTKGVHKKE